MRKGRNRLVVLSVLLMALLVAALFGLDCYCPSFGIYL